MRATLTPTDHPSSPQGPTTDTRRSLATPTSAPSPFARRARSDRPVPPMDSASVISPPALIDRVGMAVSESQVLISEHHDETDYSAFVRAVLGGSMLLIVSQSVGAALIAQFYDAQASLAFSRFLLPYLQVQAAAGAFESITLYSTVLTVGLLCLRALIPIMRPGRPLGVLDGRATGIAMALMFLGLQWYRLRDTAVALDGWTVVQTAAAAVATGVIYLGFRPSDTEAPSDTEVQDPDSHHRAAEDIPVSSQP